ncbi:MAG TPA: hypothetical protein VEZ11_17880 [Thermoanaerobaculia bacterium]|nr:hypothetical protein [Thermoanaerobaculia bacterium]
MFFAEILPSVMAELYEARPLFLTNPRNPCIRSNEMEAHEAEQIVARELSPSERLLWSGRPPDGLMLRPSDALSIPLSLFWCGFIIFWEYKVFAADDEVSWSSVLWGVPFVLAGLYSLVGRFFTDALLRANTVCAITNERVIICLRIAHALGQEPESPHAFLDLAGRAPRWQWHDNPRPWPKEQMARRLRVVREPRECSAGARAHSAGPRRLRIDSRRATTHGLTAAVMGGAVCESAFSVLG